MADQVQKPQPSPEESFRDSLADVVVIIKSLSGLCVSIDELVKLAQSGIEQDSVLRLLMEKVTPLSLRK